MDGSVNDGCRTAWRQNTETTDLFFENSGKSALRRPNLGWACSLITVNQLPLMVPACHRGHLLLRRTPGNCRRSDVGISLASVTSFLEVTHNGRNHGASTSCSNMPLRSGQRCPLHQSLCQTRLSVRIVILWGGGTCRSTWHLSQHLVPGSIMSPHRHPWVALACRMAMVAAIRRLRLAAVVVCG